LTREEEIASRVAQARERIAAAARRSGRGPESVTLVAVTKTRPASDLLAAWTAGVTHFGENRIQEAETKFPSVPPGGVRHLIGPIQSNKAARAARIADVVQTVDSVDLARRLDRAAAGKRLAVFVEVLLGDEPTKAGVAPADLPRLVDSLRAFPALDLRGLMAIPPPGDTRPHFQTLRRLAEQESLAELSMGMSDDFETAVEEGATLVRIGSALFGARIA
jgi:pyridoxal phosphate enzyme (YggS family)